MRLVSVEVLDPDVDAYNALRATWARSWADGPAADRRAWIAAIRTGAEAWVAAADAPRFLPPLARWLAAGYWEKAPPLRKRGRG